MSESLRNQREPNPLDHFRTPYTIITDIQANGGFPYQAENWAMIDQEAAGLWMVLTAKHTHAVDLRVRQVAVFNRIGARRDINKLVAREIGAGSEQDAIAALDFYRNLGLGDLSSTYASKKLGFEMWGGYSRWLLRRTQDLAEKGYHSAYASLVRFSQWGGPSR